jgi:beta-galactosidase
VYLNGVKLEGKSENGFIPFGYDLTPYIHFGEQNVIAVMVDNTFPYRTTEFGEINWANKNDYILSWHDSHWHPTHGGLYRNLYLHITDPLHITLPLYSFLKTQGTYVYSFNEERQSSGIAVEAEIYNEYDSVKTFEYEAVVYDMNGAEVLRKSIEVTLPPKTKTSDLSDSGVIKEGRAHLEGTIQNAKRWSPDYPYLYKVVSNIKVGDKVIDSEETPFGIRTWQFTKDTGFYINEHHTKLEGWGQKSTNEWAGLGAALPDWMQDFTIKLMKDAGANYIRWGHTAGSPAQIELSDKYGIIVTQPGVDGEGHLGTGYGYSDIGYQVRNAAFRDMLIYYRNNPSILLWEYGNQQVRDSNGHVNIKIMSDLIDQWDPHSKRERTARDASSNMLPYMTVVESTDGNNTGRSQGFPILESEYDRTETPRRVWDKLTPGYEDYTTIGDSYVNYTSEQFATNQANKWKAMMNTYHSGGANWIFTDSTSHGRVFSEVARSSGEVDAVRLEKEAYWGLKTIWTPEKDLHILGHWNYKEGTKKTVYVMSDAVSVELFVNGVSKGKNSKPTNNFVFEFPNIEWESGTIKAVGYDANGREVCSQTKTTHGDPVALKFTAIQGPGGLSAGGDILLVDVEAVDAAGNRALTFEGVVEFNTSQFENAHTGIWKGGYNSGLEHSVNQKSLYLEAGINRVAIQTTLNPGPIVLSGKVTAIGPAQPNKTPTTEGVTRIAPGSITVVSKPVSNENGLRLDMPMMFPYDISGHPYPGIGGGLIEQDKNDSMEVNSALIKDLLYSGENGTVNAKFEASITNPSATGEKAYNDSSAVFGQLPNYLVNGDFIYAPNSDTNYAADDFIKFIAGRDINVYVAHDDRITTKPAWLTVEDLMEDGISKRGFMKTGDKISIGSETYSVYGIQMYKGEGITLGSNKGLQSEEGNLFILFAKETRLVDNFLYDDFEMQSAGEDPEGWIVSAPTGTSAKIVNVPGISGTNTNAIRLVDSATPDLALISRKLSPLTTGRYSIKWKMRENNIGKQQQYLRIILHEGPPKLDATDSSGFVVETYLHKNQFMYRTKAGDDKTNTNIAPMAVNTWYDVELIIDMDRKTFRVYINGVLTKDAKGNTDLPFSNTSKTKINYIVLGTHGKGDSDIYLDDVSITPLTTP